ncbi:MAG: hypothetical protein F4150_07340, partial [Chloroflexi bacterium]|nr:hypothetical protein [Chloroflexota bacterium]
MSPRTVWSGPSGSPQRAGTFAFRWSLLRRTLSGPGFGERYSICADSRRCVGACDRTHVLLVCPPFCRRGWCVTSSYPHIACLLVPALALSVEVARRPELRGRPSAVVEAGARRVSEASPEAARRGVRPGQRLSEAMAWCPGLTVLAERPARARRAASQLVEAMATVSPLVEEAAPGEVYADLRGLDDLYPGEAALPQALLGAVPSALGARLGMARSRFTARAAASVASPGGWLRVAGGEARAFLAALPAGVLPLEEQERDWLSVLGLATLGDLAALPRHAVAAQLGPAGEGAWL